MIQGLYTALITPFTENGALDEGGLRLLLQRQIDAQVDGITLLGSTGESSTISGDEKKQIIRISIEEVQGRVPVMVGCGTNATTTTIEQATWAEQQGASSLLVILPYYNRPTQEGIYRHFEALSQAVSIPICIYNMPARTGVHLEVKTLKAIAELPNIAAVKEASGSITHISDVIEAMRAKNVTVLSGDDALTLPVMAIGGHGIISVLSNLIPQTIRKLVMSIQEGNYSEAVELHYTLMPLIRAAFIETNPAPIKRMLECVGLPAGKCRLPLAELTEEHDRRLQEVLQEVLQEKVWEVLFNRESGRRDYELAVRDG